MKQAEDVARRHKSVQDWAVRLNIFKPNWRLLLSPSLWESVNCAAICSHVYARSSRQPCTGANTSSLQQRTHVLSHICETQVLINVHRIWKKGAEPLISVYLCFHYKATYSALFIRRIANIIRIAGEAGGGEESGENGGERSGKMLEDLIKNVD